VKGKELFMKSEEMLNRLKELSDSRIIEGMKKAGINSVKIFGISTPKLRKIAREIGKSHELALELWESGIHEARIIAALIDEPSKVTEEQMENWAEDFDSWGICDGACAALFIRTSFAFDKAIEWSARAEEFVKRAGFVLMACLAMHGRRADDDLYEKFFPIIEKESIDNRKYVNRAVNWALRQIGKRNLRLNKLAIKTAEKIYKLNSKSAKWIASDALRELNSGTVKRRLSRPERT